MKRGQNVWVVRAAGLAAAAAVVAGCAGLAEPRDEAPGQDELGPTNIVWMVADTPPGGIDLPDRTWVRFTNATLVGPSATAATRSALLTGLHPPALGLDATGFESVPPAGVKTVPELLRSAGYYTSRAGPPRHNLVVTPSGRKSSDVNLAEKDQPGILGAWDAAGPSVDWRGRDHDWEWPCTVNFGCGSSTADPRPFFALFNLDAHTSALPAAVREILARLDSDGLAQDTVVFFVGVGSSDLDLAVRWPQRLPEGTRRDDLVTVLDLAPTVLALAGGEVPVHMEGRVFLGPNHQPPIAPDRLAALSQRLPGTIPWTDGVAPTAASPEGYPTGGLFHVAPRVELSCPTAGSSIIYTTERVAPFYWRLYRGPFRMRFWTLRAKCGRLGFHDSPVVTYDFDIE